jgi:hypothetical protein
MRNSCGQFKSVDDLRAIKGIGPKRMEKMRKYATVGKPVAPKKAANAGTTWSGSPSTAKSTPHAPAKSWHQNPSGIALKREHHQERDILYRCKLLRFI